MSLFLLALLCIDLPDSNSSVTVLKSFQNPMEVGDDFIGFPASGVFSENGRLFVADSEAARIMVWNADGTYLKGFGSKGEGPGELDTPQKICAVNGELLVWEGRRQVSVFDYDGNFKRSFRVPQINPRNFAALPGLLLSGARSFDDTGRSDMVFHTVSSEDGAVQEIKRDHNEGFVTAMTGDNGNTGIIKAYMPEVDIQPDNQGGLYYGFSQEKVLFHMDATGKTIGKTSFDFLDQKVADEDQASLMELSLPTPDGGRIGFKNLPGIKVTFDYPKAYYTHFIIKGNKILFALHAIGSVGNSGNGFNQGSYLVYNLSGGKALSRGSYNFKEDSRVFFRDGRIIACAINEDDEFEVLEIDLKGF